jgi:hypothetical protein
MKREVMNARPFWMMGAECPARLGKMSESGGDESRETILEEAQKIVDGPRQASYGDPVINHNRTAMMWSAYLAGKIEKPLNARDVCNMMVLLKMSREAHAPTRDNLVDAAGWARNAEIVSDE